MTPAAAPSRAAERTTKKAPTKWGDREGRRRDILDAAQRQMAEGGYLALNMRDIARGAGVSPGTLYQYFSTKEEIFATLYAAAIEAHNARIEPICLEATELEAFLADVAVAYLDLYTTYGRYFTLWSALVSEGGGDEAGLPEELARQLRHATFAGTDLLVATMRRVVGPAEEPRLIDQPLALTLLWTMLNGIGDHLTSERRHLTPYTGDELIAFTARTLAAGLITPA